MSKLSKVSFSTEWRLGESVVLRTMECLTPTVKFDIFITISHLFVCRSTLGFTTFEQQVCCNNVERKYIQEQQQNQIHCYNQNMGFVNTMDQRVVNYSIDIQVKKWCWSPFVWMVDVVLQGARLFYRIDKDEGDESLPFKTCC